MDNPPAHDVTRGAGSRTARRPSGISLLEMMLVVTLILIIASIATPIYRSVVVRAREAVLADHLYTLRYLIDRFTVDPSADGPLARAPRRARGEGVSGASAHRPFHWLKRNPSADGVEVQETSPPSPTQNYLGIVDVHSGSDELSLAGAPYSSW